MNNQEAFNKFLAARQAAGRDAQALAKADLEFLRDTGRGNQFSGRLDHALDLCLVNRLARKALREDKRFVLNSRLGIAEQA